MSVVDTWDWSKVKLIKEKEEENNKRKMIHSITDEVIDMPKEMEDFLEDIHKVYKKHNLALTHTDCGCSFCVDEYDRYDTDCLFESFWGMYKGCGYER